MSLLLLLLVAMYVVEQFRHNSDKHIIVFTKFRIKQTLNPNNLQYYCHKSKCTFM